MPRTRQDGRAVGAHAYSVSNASWAFGGDNDVPNRKTFALFEAKRHALGCGIAGVLRPGRPRRTARCS